MTPSDESFLRLHRSGWSVGDIAGWTPEGLYWLVWGSNGENLIRAEGRIGDEARHNTETQERQVGMSGAESMPRVSSRRAATAARGWGRSLHLSLLLFG
jgi:hypothetical protein